MFDIGVKDLFLVREGVNGELLCCVCLFKMMLKGIVNRGDMFCESNMSWVFDGSFLE